MIDRVAKLVVFFAMVVGLVTMAQWVESVLHPPPPPGLICWSVTRSTSVESRHGSRCELAEGWHLEEWPGVGRMAVPDRAVVVRDPAQDGSHSERRKEPAQERSTW